MNYIKKLVAISCIFAQIFISTTFAQQNNIEYCESQFKIYFGNGILTTEDDWLASSFAIQEIIGTEHNAVKVKYGLARNPSDGFLLDLYQSYQQKLNEDPNLSWELLFRVLLGATDLLTGGLINYVSAIISAVGNQNSAALAQKFQNQYDYADIDLALQVAELKDAILSGGHRVLLVAHSQGNLYANAAHRIVFSDPAITRKSFAVTAVATPANFVAGSGLHATSGMDGVISAVRQFVAPNTLAANINNPFNTNDFSGHQFIKSYLRTDFPSRPTITSNITSTLDSLENPDDTFDFIISLTYGLPVTPAGINNGTGTFFGSLNTCYERVYQSAAADGYGDYAASLICGPTKTWTIIDKEKEKLDPFNQQHREKFSNATGEIFRRITKHIPAANSPSSQTYAFVVGRSPFYIRGTDYRTSPITYTSIDFDPTGSPFTSFADNVTNSGTNGAQSTEYAASIDVFKNWYLGPLESVLKSIPHEVAQVESNDGNVRLKLCKLPPT